MSSKPRNSPPENEQTSSLKESANQEHEKNSNSRFQKDPDIRVLITGLEVLHFLHWPPPAKNAPRESYCKVDALRAPSHEFRIFVEEISRDTGIVSRKTFSNLRHHEFSLEIFREGSRAAMEVSKFLTHPFDGDSLEREAFQEYIDSSMAGSDDPRDYRWAVDFGCDNFYPGQPDPFPEGCFSAKVYIHRGQFYTAARTTQSFDRVTIRRAVKSSAPPYAAMYGGSQNDPSAQGGDRRTIGRVARVIGANIMLFEGEEAYLTTRGWCRTDKDTPPFPCPEPPIGQTLVKFDRNYCYKVALVNLHPIGADPAPTASDFLEYGNAFNKENGFDKVDIYDLEPTSRSYSDKVPCTPIIGH